MADLPLLFAPDKKRPMEGSSRLTLTLQKTNQRSQMKSLVCITKSLALFIFYISIYYSDKTNVPLRVSPSEEALLRPIK